MGGRDFRREDRGERGNGRDGNRDERRSDRRRDRPGDGNARNDFHRERRSEARPVSRNEARGTFDRTARRDDAPRPFRRENSGPRNRDLEAIMELDEELLRMVMRRARMLARHRTAGRLEPRRWKRPAHLMGEKAGRIGRDSRLARDLFQLVQAVEPLFPCRGKSRDISILRPTAQNPWASICRPPPTA